MAVYKLEDVCIYKNGYAFKNNEMSDFNRIQSYKIIKISNIKNKGLTSSQNDTWFIGNNPPLDYKIQLNDIVFALTGDHPSKKTESVVGSYVLINDVNERMLINQRLMILRSNDKNINQEYLFYYFNSIDFKSRISIKSRGSANQANISANDILEEVVNLPLLSEQEKIIEIIKPFEDLLVKLNMLKMNILNIISNIPCSNKKFTLSSVSSIENNAPKGIHQVSAKIMKKRDPSIYNLESPGTYKSNSFFAPKGTLLINTIRPNLNKFCILPTDADYNGTNLAVKINSKQTAIIKSLINNDFWEQCILLTKGTKMPIISKNDLLHTVIFEDVKTEIPDLFKIFQKINYLELKIEETKKELVSLLIK